MSATGRSDVREKDDFYETPEWCTRAILPHLAPLPDVMHMVLEPAAGNGAIARVLLGSGPVLPNRLVMIEVDDARAAECSAVGDCHAADFLEWARRPIIGDACFDCFDLVITNPPYRLAVEFVRASLGLIRPGGEVAMLLRLNWLASQRRAAFHRTHPSDVYVLPRRPSFVRGTTDATDYGWFVWGPGRGNRWSILDLGEA
jgi:hypothetical protein